MSRLATIIMASGAIHAYVCAYYTGLYIRQRRGPEHLGFGLLSAALVVHAVGAALYADAASEAEAARALGIQWLGGGCAAALFVLLCYQLLGRSRAPIVKVAMALGAVNAVAALSGALIDPAKPAAAPVRGFDWAPHYVWVSFHPLLFVLIMGSLVLGVVAAVQLARGARRSPELRIVVAGTIPGLLAWTHDMICRIVPLRSVFLLEHAIVITSVAVSYALTRRFVRARGELTRRTEELQRSYEELQRVQQELVHKEQLAAIGELSAIIAHEVRNPLAVLMNAVSSLRRPKLPAVDRELLLEVLDEEVDRLNRLVRDLLTYARPVSLQATPVDLVEVVHQALEEAQRSRSRVSGIDVDIDLTGAPSRIHGDRDLLQRALLNIVENALQAMSDGGVLSVRARMEDSPAGKTVVLVFHDTGEGMDTLVRRRARDPFFTTRPFGTGLGLAIVDRVARAHGGKLELQSAEGSGTTVSLVLPRRQPGSTPPPDR